MLTRMIMSGYRRLWGWLDLTVRAYVYFGECEQGNSRTMRGMISRLEEFAKPESVDGTTMQLFSVVGIMLSFVVNYGINQQINTLSAAKWRIPFAL